MDEDVRRLRDLLEGGVSAGDFVGYDCLVAHDDDVVLRLIGGFSQLIPERKPMYRKPVFDMASITKPAATATAAMVAIEKGKFGLNTEITDIIPEATNLSRVRICDLMSHRSGLPDGIPLHKNARSRQDCIDGLMRVKPTRPPNEAEVYSDLGYMMVGLAMEKVFDRSQKQISRDLIFRPLGMRKTSFVPSAALRRRAVATELQADGLPLIGVVHDENARAMEGVAGHAGLFSTAEDLLKLSVMMIGEGKIKGKRFLSEETVELMATNQNKAISGNYGYGWVTKRSESMFGERCSNQSFGHTGFTGTCVAVDPVKHISSIFLTSAVHPKRKETSINPYRRAVFDLAIEIGSER
jgi:CubicO group peptidase (beta-lactamase class C family)